jgi:hypothetical protein
MRVTLDLLLLIVNLLCQRLGLNISNISKSRSSDQNRKRYQQITVRTKQVAKKAIKDQR